MPPETWYLYLFTFDARIYNLNKVIYHLKHRTHPWQPQQPDSHVTKFWVVGSYPMYIYKAVGQFTIFDIKI